MNLSPPATDTDIDGDNDVQAQLAALDQIEQMIDQAREQLEQQAGAGEKGTDTPDEGEPSHDIGATDPTGEAPGDGDDELEQAGTGRIGSGKSLLGKLLGR